MATSSDSHERYSSRLAAKADRFVSELFARMIENGWRNAENFIDHFSVESIVEALADEEELRVRLLVETTGTHERIAAKKSISSAAEDLTLALDEGTTSADAILALFDADDWVRLLGAKAIWAFAVGDKFWNADAEDTSAFSEALERVSDTIYCAIQHRLVTEGDVVEAVGFERLAQGLDETQLREIVVFALESGKRGEPLTAESLLDVIPIEGVIEKVSLNRAWSEVVVQHVVQPLELGAEGVAAKSSGPPEEDEHRPRESRSERSKKNHRSDARPNSRRGGKAASERNGRRHAEAAERDGKPLAVPESGRRRSQPPPPRAASSAPPPPPPAHAQQPTQSAPPARPQSIPPPPPSARAAAARASAAPKPPPQGNDPVLIQAISRLNRIDRLPARHTEFPAPVLHAIEAMYTELATVSDAQEQLNIIKDAFPNDLWRARAMLALLELLNPSMYASTPTLVNESADSLSIRLLTEERQLSRNAASARSTAQAGQRPSTR